MISPALRAEVCQANLRLVSAGLVTLSWGNASGVPYETLGPDDMVVVSLRDGSVLEGDLRPSSDTPTHLALYRRYPTLAGIVHTHSTQATAWAQAGRDIPVFGTTHADHFRGSVPVSRQLTDAEIEGAYEAETGKVIIETIDSLVDDPLRMTAILVRSHGPFTWGRSPAGAVEAAIALELVATMALHVLALDPAASPVPEALLRRHFDRKHGPGAYYGQPGTTT
jgi:L-ribulose-5-phosphate 4-epimerase